MHRLMEQTPWTGKSVQVRFGLRMVEWMIGFGWVEGKGRGVGHLSGVSVNPRVICREFVARSETKYVGGEMEEEGSILRVYVVVFMM